ncbi:NADH dehydrogenase FAD-containing subunit [Williamsia muralis]|uniref:NADH dehydrogenase FAD-containing subunit n=1 Tax=Williamsia marianensis TaxID=85044 RepID=A0A495K2C1_WILMA|nr:NADH dehydrogenase FAD-containing subunit [Williamsia muralis]
MASATGDRVTRKRVVVAGLGDSGVLTAIHLAGHVDVVGISVKPGLVSGQELGTRLSRPDDWSRDYWVSFDRFRGLDGVRTVHGTITDVDLAARTLAVRSADDSTSVESYDALVISTGVSNGFWRTPTMQSPDEVKAGLLAAHERLAAAPSVMVIGGGAAAVSSAANVAGTWSEKKVSLWYPGERALPQHHIRTWRRVRGRLMDLGVQLHPGHRAALDDGFVGDEITTGSVTWTTGQAPASADAVLWAVGRVRPNTGWLPESVLDAEGFVRVNDQLQVPGHPGVFALGDVAASDPLRGSARNRADRLVARNVRAELAGRSLRGYRPRQRRWGSVLGVQPDGLEVFTPSGRPFRFPAWSIDRVLQPWIVRRGIYGGVRNRDSESSGVNS